MGTVVKILRRIVKKNEFVFFVTIHVFGHNLQMMWNRYLSEQLLRIIFMCVCVCVCALGITSHLYDLYVLFHMSKRFVLIFCQCYCLYLFYYITHLFFILLFKVYAYIIQNIVTNQNNIKRVIIPASLLPRLVNLYSMS